MKRISLRNVLWGVAVGLAVLTLKSRFLPCASRQDWEAIQEKVIASSDNNRKEKFFFVFKHYIFFVTKKDEEVVVRVFRIFGLPMATFRYDATTRDAWRRRVTVGAPFSQMFRCLPEPKPCGNGAQP